jgi:hypothetical protein
LALAGALLACSKKPESPAAEADPTGELPFAEPGVPDEDPTEVEPEEDLDHEPAAFPAEELGDEPEPAGE